MKRIGMISMLCAGLLTGAGCNRARNSAQLDNDTGTQPIGTSGAGEHDAKADLGARQFVLDSLADGTHEVQVGRLAAEKAQSAEVKQFAQMMVQDHTKAGEQLKKIAAAHQIQGPTDLGDNHTKLMDKLSKLSGADFDREYMSAMVDDHEEDVEQLEKRADVERVGKDKGAATPEKGADPFETRVNQWAASTLPTVRQHLERAKEINSHLGNKLTRAMKSVMPGK